jgi:hypothetical protein
MAILFGCRVFAGDIFSPFAWSPFALFGNCYFGRPEMPLGVLGRARPDRFTDQ